MNGIWQKIINNLRTDARDLHTIPKTEKQPVWFYACTDGAYIYVSNAKHHNPSSNITGTRTLNHAEFERIYPIYLRREKGESVSREATQATTNQVYWYSIFKFCLQGDSLEEAQISSNQPLAQNQSQNTPIMMNSGASISNKNLMKVMEHEFTFIQSLIPEKNANGSIRLFNPQKNYQNTDHIPLSMHGQGSFCRFYVSCTEVAGVYLWVMDQEIIYIGETSNLRQRFNQGYGNISPRNCFIGGQSTNCKMNKVVLKHTSEGKVIRLYFCPTAHHKELELKLLRSIKTRYNDKDNQGNP